MSATETPPVADSIAPLREFVIAMSRLIDTAPDERTVLARGRELLARLLADDDWLPPDCALPDPQGYRQYLLHCDPLERFSVVSFVWGPGQFTPVHDHTVWGLIGILRGAERCTEYAPDGGRIQASGTAHTMRRGMIEAVSPTLGDWHLVANALPDQPSVSIHVYGANIGAIRRHRLDDEGRIFDFVSGYSNARVPNLWDRSSSANSNPIAS